MRQWLTPDQIPESAIFRLNIPDSNEWRAAVRGALLNMCEAVAWEQFGTQTPEACAAAAFQIFQSLEVTLYVGTILFTGGDFKPDSALWCDGSAVFQEDWPMLYNVVGNNFGSAPPGYFKLPDLRSRVPLGSGQGSGLSNYSIGDQGGEEKHALSSGENAPHEHSVHGHGVGAMGELPAPCDVPGFPGSTGTSGSGNAHENRPPYLALRAYIIGR